MALKKTKIVSTLLCLMSHAWGAPIELATKQSVENLRYVSDDGKVTYYQNTSGTLYYSTNYKVIPLLKSAPATQYNVIVSPTKKAILIEKNAHQYDFLSLRAPREIYLAKYKETAAKIIGKGTKPRLHLEDQWLSFYNAEKRELHFLGIKDRSAKFTVRLRNKVNPYFIPEVEMISENKVLYTDINIKGITGILEFNRQNGKMAPLVKASSPLEKIELCANSEKLFIGIFGLSDSKVGSSISFFHYKKEGIEKRDLIYESNQNDLGHIKCSNKDKLYFIKKSSDNTTDAASLDLKTKQTIFLSDKNSITQLIEMDKKLITESMGKYYILDGSNNLGDDIWTDNESN